jgi:hypothetical protein
MTLRSPTRVILMINVLNSLLETSELSLEELRRTMPEDLEAKLIKLMSLRLVLLNGDVFLIRPGEKLLVRELIWCAEHNLSALDLDSRMRKRYHSPPTLEETQKMLLTLNPNAPRVMVSTDSTGV